MVNIFRPIRGTGQEEENDRVPPGLRRQDSNLTSKTSNTNRTINSKLSKVSEKAADGQPRVRIKNRGIISLYVFGLCYKRDNARRYKMMLEESRERLNKQLDIVRLVEGQEFVKAALDIILSANQSRIIRHLSLENLTLSLGGESKVE